jgi:hypothetical protein
MGKAPGESVSSYRARLDALGSDFEADIEPKTGILAKIRGFLNTKFGIKKEAA